MKKSAFLFFLLSLSAPAIAATYFVDFVGGNDANNGTAKGTPWQLAPGMQGFAGTYTHAAGDQFIFKGGVTWPNPSSSSPFPFDITNDGGGDLTVDYYGVDTTWFDGGACGASFCRPVFDMQSRVVASTNVTIIIDGNYVKIDNIEITNLFWTGTAQAGAILIGNNGLRDSLYNLYIHNWTHGGGGTTDVFRAVASSTTAFGGLYNSEITGLPSTNSGTGAYNVPFISSCSIHDVSRGWVVTNGIITELINSRVFNINPSFDGVTPSAPVQTTGVAILGSNYIYNFAAATKGIVTQPSHSNVAGDDAYYNNLVWNTGAKTPFVMDTGGPTASSANPYFYNNTIVQDTNGFCLAIGQSNAGSLGTLTYANNFCISDISGTMGAVCTSGQDPVNCAGLTGQTPTDDLLESHALAATNGYVLADFFSPTASTSPTVDQGFFNNAVQASADIRGVPRPQGIADDIGAYEYCAGCGFGPSTLAVASFGGTPQSASNPPVTVNFDASASTAPGAVITQYDWTFGDGTFANGLTGPTTSHIYTTFGNYRSTVTITTSLGAHASAYGYIVILPAPASLDVQNAVTTNGSDVSVDISLTPSPDVTMGALWFDLVLPTSVSYTSTTVGPAALGKIPIDVSSTPRILIGGDASIPMTAGVVATVHLHVAPGISLSSISIGLANLAATDTTLFVTIPVTGSGGNVTISQGVFVEGSSGFSPRVYPSPWRSDQDAGVPMTFDQLAGNCTIKIFTTSARKVKSFSTSAPSITWNRDNESGDTVASGLYFYVITNDQGQKATGKFVIIK